MPKVTIYHFPNWGSSKNALAVAEELGVDHEVVLYIKTPPDRKALQSIIDGLEDPVEDLVRKDSKFKKLELNPDDYVDNPEAVIEILLKHKQLLQRPIIVKGKKAIIGRPKDRIKKLLSWAIYLELRGGLPTQGVTHPTKTGIPTTHYIPHSITTT